MGELMVYLLTGDDDDEWFESPSAPLMDERITLLDRNTHRARVLRVDGREWHATIAGRSRKVSVHLRCTDVTEEPPHD